MGILRSITKPLIDLEFLCNNLGIEWSVLLLFWLFFVYLFVSRKKKSAVEKNNCPR